MNRRDSLKFLGIGALSAATLVEGCKSPGKNPDSSKGDKAADAAQPGRLPNEIARDKKLNEEKFFNDHEMATITVLADIIIPKDAKSGSASDAKVPDFIEFIVKDMPEHQIPMRGGLRWLDMQSLNRYNQPFVALSNADQLEIVTAIAYPNKARPEMQQGVAFFNRMRDLTATGFFTSKMGIEDLGYVGNSPNVWNGVPEEILKQYGMEGV